MKNQNGCVDSSLHEALFRSMNAPRWPSWSATVPRTKIRAFDAPHVRVNQLPRMRNSPRRPLPARKTPCRPRCCSPSRPSCTLRSARAWRRTWTACRRSCWQPCCWCRRSRCRSGCSRAGSPGRHGRARRPAGGPGLKILLAHQPRSAFAAAAAGYDLQFPGHSQGGQFPAVDLLHAAAAAVHGRAAPHRPAHRLRQPRYRLLGSPQTLRRAFRDHCIRLVSRATADSRPPARPQSRERVKLFTVGLACHRAAPTLRRGVVRRS